MLNESKRFQMKLNQLSTIMQYTPLIQMGYIFNTTQHGIGVVEETKKIAADIWKQKFVYINMAQADMYDVHLLLVEHAKEMEPTTFFFDGIEKLTDEMRNFIFVRFSINREDYIHPSCHVIYNVNDDNDETFKPEWNDYILCHGMLLNIEP